MQKEKIKEALKEAIVKGYHPCYDLESAEDHGADWTALTLEEFNEIWRSTTLERKKKATASDIETLDKVVLGTLELHGSYNLPVFDFGKCSRRLVVASGNALPTGKILFEDEDAVFADEGQYKAIIKKAPIDGAVVISASGEKHAPLIISDLIDNQLAPFLITCNSKSTAAKMLTKDRVLVTKQNIEPITYNTSTYIGMIFSKTKENPIKIRQFIKEEIEPRMTNMTKYGSFYIIVEKKFDIVREMFLTKFDELFGPMINGRCYTVEQTLHAKTVVNSPREAFISLGYKNDTFGHVNSRLNFPLYEGASYAAIIAIGYYIIGHIQSQFHPWFIENAEAYKNLQPELFDKVLNS